jgi:transketolase
LLALSRQTVSLLSTIPVETRRSGVLRGAYVAKKESEPLELILLGSGSELQHLLKAAEVLGPRSRVVSVPCFERFERQSLAYQEEVLPGSCRRRVSLEASEPTSWYRYVGPEGRTIGIKRFGLSAPGGETMKELGITAEHVVEVAQEIRKC